MTQRLVCGGSLVGVSNSCTAMGVHVEAAMREVMVSWVGLTAKSGHETKNNFLLSVLHDFGSIYG